MVRTMLGVSSLAPIAELRALVGAAIFWSPMANSSAPAPGSRGRSRWRRTSTRRNSPRQYLLGHVELAAGNLSEARDLFSCSLDEYRTLAIPSGTGGALTGLAWVALVTGE